MTLSAARRICQHPPQADSRTLRPLFSTQVWPPACPEALGWRWVSALTHRGQWGSAHADALGLRLREALSPPLQT